MAKGPELSRSDLRSVATFQKIILICILAYFVLFVSQFALPVALRIFVAIPALGLMITSAVFVFLLSTKVYSLGLGLLLAFLTLIPLIGLIMLLIINGKATSILRAHDIPVGFLGANLSDL